MHRPVCEAARSAAADSPCLGSGSAAKTLVQPCIGRLSVVAGTAGARWLRQLAAVCWAEVLPATATEADRALGPMLPASARERWPFCVVRDSCHAALPDQPGLPPIGSGRRTGGSRRRPYPLRLAAGGHCMDAAGAGPSCMGVSLSNRKSVAQTRLCHAVPEMEPSKAVRVQLCACRRLAERPGRPRSCRQGRTERVVAGLRPKEGAALTAAEFGRGVTRFGSARVRFSIFDSMHRMFCTTLWARPGS